MSTPKRILIVALENRVEALRMATGLTLSDATLRVAVWGRTPSDDAARTQLEALEFAEVPIEELATDEAAGCAALARRIIDSDVVYCV